MPKALVFVAAMLSGMWLYRITTPGKPAAGGADPRPAAQS